MGNATKTVLSVLAALVVIAAVYYLAVARGATQLPAPEAGQAAPVAATSSPAAPAATSTVPASSKGGGATAPSGYTMAQVATHANASSCWTAINGGVYDLTAWISQHPGGERAILSICGKDGSAAFNAQHGGQGRPEATLATFSIGALAS